MYTFGEIRAFLGHEGQRVSYMKADCEGCEWDWIDTAMRENPTVFELIDQMFLEVHFSTTLRFSERAIPLAPSFYRMVTSNFRLRTYRVNSGYGRDQFHVPEVLVRAGVHPQHCCREFNFINIRVMGS